MISYIIVRAIRSIQCYAPFSGKWSIWNEMCFMLLIGARRWFFHNLCVTRTYLSVEHSWQNLPWQEQHWVRHPGHVWRSQNVHFFINCILGLWQELHSLWPLVPSPPVTEISHRTNIYYIHPNRSPCTCKYPCWFYWISQFLKHVSILVSSKDIKK